MNTKSALKRGVTRNIFDDLLSQIHINAEILSKKFRYLTTSLRVLLVSVIPWLFALYYSKLYIK